MKNKKFEISVIVFLSVFSFIVYGFYLINNHIEEKNNYILYLKPFSLFKCNNNKCENISEKLDDYNKQEFHVFIDAADEGNNMLYYNSVFDKFYVYDVFNNNIYTDSNKTLFGYIGEKEISGISFEREEASINEILDIQKQLDYNINNNNVFIEKITLDYDGDNSLENVYYLNNFDEESNDYFSMIIYKDNNKMYLLDEEHSSDRYKLPFYSVSNIIDVKNDGKLELIVNKSYYDEIGYCLVLYKLKGRKYIPLNNCEIIN